MFAWHVGWIPGNRQKSGKRRPQSTGRECRASGACLAPISFARRRCSFPCQRLRYFAPLQHRQKSFAACGRSSHQAHLWGPESRPQNRVAVHMATAVMRCRTCHHNRPRPRHRESPSDWTCTPRRTARARPASRRAPREKAAGMGTVKRTEKSVLKRITKGQQFNQVALTSTYLPPMCCRSLAIAHSRSSELLNSTYASPVGCSRSLNMRCTPFRGTESPGKKSRMSLRVALYGSPRILTTASAPGPDIIVPTPPRT